MGQPAARVEDQRFLTGQGRYIDDIKRAGQLYGVFVRSPHAHAVIQQMDVSDAATLPGVVGIYTVEDLTRDDIGDVPCLADIHQHDGSP